MTFAQKISEVRKRNILVPDILASGEAIVGVYGFFAIKDNTEECFYIGKASNVVGRILDSGGHLSVLETKSGETAVSAAGGLSPERVSR